MSCRSLALALALALGACETCPPDRHVIRAMRVLGTTFDPPVAAPGGAVTVRVLTADVEARDVEVAWYRCPSNLVFVPPDRGPGPGPRIREREEATNPFAAQAAACIARGEFARGLSVRVPVDADGGALDASPYRTARRWTDLVGFACADGAIESPPASGAWPRCTGARGVVFTASIPGPMADGSTAAPPTATLENFSLGRGASASAWAEGDVPEVDRCDGTRQSCPAWELRFDVAAAATAVEVAGDAPADATDDTAAFVTYHVTGMAPSGAASCDVRGDDTVAQPTTSTRAGASRLLLRWVPPAAEGEVTFWFTARRFSGGLSMARRTVRVR